MKGEGLMFVDQGSIVVKAGKGGDGMVAFRREKFVTNGGPAGGDGGRGGSIILRVNRGLRTLMDFRYHRIFKAKSGENGMSKSMYGRKAEDLVIDVPEGTTVSDTDTGEVLGDLTEDGQELVVAHGGRGGRGNIHFASAKNPAPEIAENGEPGEDRVLRLELRVLADAGLVGFPSVGKSTLLSVATNARPKIASYEFTTLTPNLGMVLLDSGRDFSMADLPGLIAGASKGVGLGIQFLRHVERTKVILHLVSMDPNNGREAIDEYNTINHELANYQVDLTKKKQLIVASQMDLPGTDEKLAEFKKALGPGKKVYPISSVTHQGVKELLEAAWQVIEQVEKEEPAQKPVQKGGSKTYVYKKPVDQFTVEKAGEHYFVIHGASLERLVAMTNTEHQDGIMLLARKLKSLGVDDALRAKGAVNGDDVQIGEFSFEFVE